MQNRTGQRSLAAAALVGLFAIGGCGGSGDASPEATTTKSVTVSVDAGLHARIPDDIAASGKLVVVTDASYPPIESFAEDGQTVIGVDPEISAAIGALIGIDVEIRNADFGTLAELVKGGEADLVLSAMTDTPEREIELDFVNYFAAGTSVVVQRGNPQLVTDIASLCGHTVAVEGETTQEALIERYQAKCSNPITVLTGTTNDDALVLLRTGRAVAVLMDYPPAEWLTTDPETHSHYELSTTAQYEPGLYGIGVAKDRTDLRNLIRDAVGKLIASGAYQAILDKWNVGHGAVTQVSINAAGGR